MVEAETETGEESEISKDGRVSEMPTKRMTTWSVSVDFPLPDGTNLRRRIAENALTAKSAINKVDKLYSGKPHTIVAVRRYK